VGHVVIGWVRSSRDAVVLEEGFATPCGGGESVLGLVGGYAVAPAAASSVFAAAVAGAGEAVASRWPGLRDVNGEVPPWLLAAAVSGGRLLAPGWP
jgi:hypothetical protein